MERTVAAERQKKINRMLQGERVSNQRDIYTRRVYKYNISRLFETTDHQWSSGTVSQAIIIVLLI